LHLGPLAGLVPAEADRTAVRDRYDPHPPAHDRAEHVGLLNRALNPTRRGVGGGVRRRIPAMGVIDDYLEDLGDSQRAALERIRRIVLDRVPDAEEGRSYGMPAFRYKRKPLLGFAALKDHLSLFPFSPQVVAAVRGRLAGYDLSKGTIRFTEAKPIPEDVIWEILDLRLEEIG
jgi:uncharacterized protein YdhG (YjbR/CyaY superfamily)